MTKTIEFLNTLSKEVHQNAVEHGWWEEERNFGEIIALIHSELSEALEEYRNGHAVTEIYYNGDKPEGVPVELADVVIRSLDVVGKYGWELKEPEYLIGEIKKCERRMKEKPFAEVIAVLHTVLSEIYIDFMDNQGECVKDQIVDMAVYLACWFRVFDIDFEPTILLKHEYNKTRPYKHGGKII